LRCVRQGSELCSVWLWERTIFAQPTRSAAGQQVGEVLKAKRSRWPAAAQLLADAEEEALADMAFPPEDWTRIYSTNPLERLNKEIKRRTNVVGIFPDEPAVLRLVWAVLMEQSDEWDRPVCSRSCRLDCTWRRSTDIDPKIVEAYGVLVFLHHLTRH
jgi:transposase-like protein